MPNFADLHTPQRIVAELSMAKMTRAVYSERQLNEEMVDFWYNHFNVFAAKGADKWLITSYERDAIRPHAMGKFRDLLEATAKESRRCCFSLDNWLSADPVAAWAKFQQEQEARQAFRPRAVFSGRDAQICGSIQYELRTRTSAQGQKKAAGTRAERELRPRTDGTAHARSGWRLYTAGRHQRRERGVYGMDDSTAAPRRGVCLR